MNAPAVHLFLVADLWEQRDRVGQQCSPGREVMAAACSLQGWRERCCSAKSPPRSGLPVSAICTEPKGGSNKGSRREEEEEEGSPNKHVPQRTLAGSNPAWALFQHRKLPAVRLESDAGRFINSKSQMRKGRLETERKEWWQQQHIVCEKGGINEGRWGEVAGRRGLNKEEGEANRKGNRY